MKKVKLIAILTLVMLSSVMLVACGNGNGCEPKEVNFVVGYENMSVAYSENHDSTIIIRTLQEWNALSASRLYLSGLSVKYNESFFGESALYCNRKER